ncbi:MAG: hypothetical protein ACEQSB_01145 [Undibacterium sp.]
MQRFSRTQIILILWVTLPFVFSLINSVWFEPKNIWVNNSGTGIPSTSVVLGIPAFFLFNVYYIVLKPFVSIDSGGSGAFMQIVPGTNPFGTILISSLIVVTFAVIAFFIGRAMKDRAWEKYLFYAFALFVVFDSANYLYQLNYAVQAKPALDTRAAVIARCNGTAPEYAACQERCSTEWSGLAKESAEIRNSFWTTCTAKCDPLQTEFQTKCLRESGLPEYEHFTP